MVLHIPFSSVARVEVHKGDEAASHPVHCRRLPKKRLLLMPPLEPLLSADLVGDLDFNLRQQPFQIKQLHHMTNDCRDALSLKPVCYLLNIFDHFLAEELEGFKQRWDVRNAVSGRVSNVFCKLADIILRVPLHENLNHLIAEVKVQLTSFLFHALA